MYAYVYEVSCAEGVDDAGVENIARKLHGK